MRLLTVVVMLVFAMPAVAGEQEIAQARARVLSFYESQYLHRTNMTGLVDLNLGDEQECIDVVQTCAMLAGVETNQTVLAAMSYVVGICGSRMMLRSKGGWCTNDAFLSSLTTYYVAKRTSESLMLDELASPRWLNRHGEVLKPYTLSTTNRYLCGMLDSISLTEMRNIVPSNSPNLWPLWAFARKGDTNAENQLLKYAIAPMMNLSSGVRPSGEELGNSGSEKLLRLAARELRSEEYDEYVCEWDVRGNPTRANTVLRRRIWATAIYTAMRNEEAPETPWVIGSSSIDWDDEGLSSLDPLEKWCTRKFGIEYPKTPRKRLPFYGLPDREADRLVQKFAMELRTTPVRVVLPGFAYREIALTNLNAWTEVNREKVPEWRLIGPETMPIDTAITFLKGFIYGPDPEDPAENPPLGFAPSGRKLESSLGVAIVTQKSVPLDKRDRFSLNTPVPDPYSEVLDKYGRRRMTGTTDRYECEGSIDALGEVLPILMKGVPSVAKDRTIAFSSFTRGGDPARADSIAPFVLLRAVQIAKEAGFEYVVFVTPGLRI